MSPTYIDITQARRHPSLAHEGLPCLPYDMPYMMDARRQDADAKTRRCRPTDLEPGLIYLPAEEDSALPLLLFLLPCLISRMLVPLTRTPMEGDLRIRR